MAPMVCVMPVRRQETKLFHWLPVGVAAEVSGSLPKAAWNVWRLHVS